MPIVRIRESPYDRGSFLKKIHENFVTGHWKLSIIIEVSVLEKCPFCLNHYCILNILLKIF